MTSDDIKLKNLVLIQYLNSIISGYKIKAEFSTNDNDINVIVVQETSGEKIVFYDNDNPLFNYYDIEIFGDSIENEKNTSTQIGNLIGKTVYVDFKVKNVTQNWQIIFKQISNPRAINYEEIRRVSYSTTLKCIVNRIS